MQNQQINLQNLDGNQHYSNFRDIQPAPALKANFFTKDDLSDLVECTVLPYMNANNNPNNYYSQYIVNHQITRENFTFKDLLMPSPDCEYLIPDIKAAHALGYLLKTEGNEKGSQEYEEFKEIYNKTKEALATKFVEDFLNGENDVYQQHVEDIRHNHFKELFSDVYKELYPQESKACCSIF